MFAGIGGFGYGLEACNREQQENSEASGYRDSISSQGEQPKQSEEWGNNACGKSQPKERESKKGWNRFSIVRETQLCNRLNSPFNCVWANEWDKWAAAIYRKNFGRSTQQKGAEESRECECDKNELAERQHLDSERWECPELCEADIRTVDTDAIPEHELLTAGFPCQSFSIAGQRGGLADIRGTLFQEICRVAGAKGTPYLLLENVRGLLSVPYTEAVEDWEEEDFDSAGEPTARAQKKHKGIPGTKGWVFLTILNSLWELGYDCQWEVLNSKDFGVPQNRERVFIVGHLRGTSRPEVFPIGKSEGENVEEYGNRDIARPVTTVYAHSTGKYMDLIYEGAIMSEKNKKWLEDGKTLSRNFPQGQRVYSPTGIASSICGNAGGIGGKTGLYVVPAIRAEHHNTEDVHYIVKPVLTPDRENKRQHGRRMKEDGEPMFTLTGQDIHGVQIANALGNDDYEVRRLIPLECERLQGFPDDWTRYGIDIYGNEIEISDSQRYKCCGNAVSTSVPKAIGQVLLGQINIALSE
jgi:DNA (cytosine-5)-methyltransferase 1